MNTCTVAEDVLECEQPGRWYVQAVLTTSSLLGDSTVADDNSTQFVPLSKDRRFHDLTGMEFGGMTVLGYLGPSPTCHAVRMWLCRCKCGLELSVAASNLKKNKRHRGCVLRARTPAIHEKTDAQHPLYDTWKGMLARCYDSSVGHYSLYGGRGIRVCERWWTLRWFAEDMGPKPTDLHTLDRYPDNNGNYEPCNCRWATPVEQNRNRRNNRTICWNGETLTIPEWSDRLGIPTPTLHSRLRKGYTIDRVLSVDRVRVTTSASCVVSYRGETRTLCEWARHIGVGHQTLTWRLHHWTDLDRIMSPEKTSGYPR